MLIASKAAIEAEDGQLRTPLSLACAPSPRMAGFWWPVSEWSSSATLLDFAGTRGIGSRRQDPGSIESFDFHYPAFRPGRAAVPQLHAHALKVIRL